MKADELNGKPTYQDAPQGRTHLPTPGDGVAFRGLAGKLVKDPRFMTLGADFTGGRSITPGEMRVLLGLGAIQSAPLEFVEDLLESQDLYYRVDTPETQIELIFGLRELGVSPLKLRGLIAEMVHGVLFDAHGGHLWEIANGGDPNTPRTKSIFDDAAERAGMTTDAEITIV